MERKIRYHIWQGQKTLMKKAIVKVFVPKKRNCADASELAMSTILSQDAHPFMYWPRKLTLTEINYSNIENGALVIVKSIERARQFLLGQKFLLKTDHKPLEFIFNPQKELPKAKLLHILRCAIKLMAFDFNIKYVKEHTIQHVGTLLQLKFDNKKKDEILHRLEILSFQHLKTENLQDSILNNVYWRIKRNRWNNCSKT